MMKLAIVKESDRISDEKRRQISLKMHEKCTSLWFVIVNLVLFSSLFVFSIQSNAADLDPSGYSLYSGGEFYVLTDGVFGTKQEIAVRFESTNGSLQNYGGVDVRLYRIPKPLEFLKAQKNLHRPVIKGAYFGEGLSNVLSYLWDSWYKKSRLAWQRVFSSEARKEATALAPELVHAPPHSYKTQFHNEPQFARLKGLELVDSFRYPVWLAKPNQPQKDTTMEGSSSNFLQMNGANVMLPLGKRKPGLYLVEAMIGSFRATTLVFVSDTIVVTKVSSLQGFVWTVNRETGMPQPKSHVMITDGIGTLDQGTGDADGVFTSKHSTPERSFAIVEDNDGGVAISENFFYDSEVYQPKIFVFTDRPLYQPGDTVYVRALGRDIKRSGAKDQWSALPIKTASLTVVDAMGVPLLTQSLSWKGIDGGETKFQLPNAAESGGYTLRFSYDHETYGAVFRVAKFTKPHFDVQINFSKAAYKVGEEINGTVSLVYPSGSPVANAAVNLQLRSEQMSMFEGSYSYAGDVPVELSVKTYKSNAKGLVHFKLPVAKHPSRYIASVRAMDKAAYRVTAKKEALIEGFLETYILKSDFSATQPNMAVHLTYERQGADAAAEMSQQLKTWQAIRLEDRTVSFGKVNGGERGSFEMTLEKPGHYVIRVVDINGIARGTRSHVVLGPELKSSTGEVEILADKDEYAIGETAKILLTFPQIADDALLTLERNDVNAHGRLASHPSWFSAKRLTPTQWQVEVAIHENFAPNKIFSVAYARAGDFGFQNKGLIVRKPTIHISFKADKEVYAPGDQVNVELQTDLLGRPISSMVSVSVVDEMIYVLQPDVAPSINEFFNHLRRNQVRTTSSMQFYSFNPATSDVQKAAASVSMRDLKEMTERARRDTRDTAYWNGDIKTDIRGRAHFSFVMPDSLSRWRITAKAMAIEPGKLGVVGEAKGSVLSNKNYFVTWTGPKHFRVGDRPKPAIAIFNSTKSAQSADLILSGPDYLVSQSVKLEPGSTTVVLGKLPTRSSVINAKINVGGHTVDALETAIDFTSANWLDERSQSISLQNPAPLSLPLSATDVRVKIVPEAAYQVARIADDLLEYPWGCVEQTASRLIPMTMAVRSLEAVGGATPQTQSIRDRIAADRRRLISMAGPGAVFAWWGETADTNLLVTAHAYHADWRASRLLGIALPRENWDHLLDIYSKTDSSFVARAYALWVLSYFDLPVAEQSKALMTKLSALPFAALKNSNVVDTSVFMDDIQHDVALSTLIIADVSLKNGVAMTPDFKARVASVLKNLPSSPVYQSAALLHGVLSKEIKSPADRAFSILESVKLEAPTIDRSIALAFVEEAFPSVTVAENAKVAKVAKKDLIQIDLGKEWVRDGASAIPSFRPSPLVKIPNSLPSIKGAVAEVSYKMDVAAKSTLDASIERKLYRVNFKSGRLPSNDPNDDSEPTPMELDVVEVGSQDVLDPDALYVDHLKITPRAQQAQFLLLEVPLPPGGEVDESTWGITFKNLKTNFTQARSSAQALGYSIPVGSLKGPLEFDELVRFSSRGQFVMPPARLFRMYRPESHSYEGATARRAISIQ